MISDLVPIERASLPPASTIHPLRTWYRSHELVDLALPGDESSIVEYKTKRSVDRDSRFTPVEFEVYCCMIIRLRYHTPVCLNMNCTWCGGLKPGDLGYFRNMSRWA